MKLSFNLRLLQPVLQLTDDKTCFSSGTQKHPLEVPILDVGDTMRYIRTLYNAANSTINRS